MRATDVAAAPSAPPGRSRTENAPADPLGFPALLTKTKARTAVAEGQTPKTEEHRGRGHAYAFGHLPREERAAAKAAAREERAAAKAAASAPAPADEPTTPTTGDTPDATAPTSTNVTGATAPEPTTVPDPAASGAVGGTAPDSADGSGTVAGGAPTTDPGAPGATGTGADDLPGATSSDVSTTPVVTATVSALDGSQPAVVTVTSTSADEPVDPAAGDGAGQPATSTTADTADTADTAGTAETDTTDTTAPPADTTETPAEIADTTGTTAPPADTTETPADPADTTDTTAPTATAEEPVTDDDGAATGGDEQSTTGDGRGQGNRPGGPALPETASDRARAAVAAAHDGTPGRSDAAHQRHETAPTAVAPTTTPTVTTVVQPVVTAPATAAALPAAWTSRGLGATVERLVDLVHVATARGVARAKLQLHPAELGGITVRLRQSAEGLIASITAQRADGLEAVTQAGAELRRTLEERGVTIARLDISLAADGHGDRGWHGPQDRSSLAARGTRRTTTDTTDPRAGETVAVAPATVHTTPGAGTLVDVQA